MTHPQLVNTHASAQLRVGVQSLPISNTAALIALMQWPMAKDTCFSSPIEIWPRSVGWMPPDVYVPMMVSTRRCPQSFSEKCEGANQ